MHGLTRLLECPTHPAHASVRLKQCDRLFEHVDQHMRRFPATPNGWRTPAYDAAGSIVATDAYDELSFHLRSRGGVVVDGRTLAAARKEWDRLQDTIHAGSWPQPWARR